MTRAILTHRPEEPARRADEVHVLHPGDVMCLPAGSRMQTLLGSCVAICMTDSDSSIGVMCHYVHSVAPRSGCERDTSFAGPALKRMFADLRAHGVDPLLCEAYVCGGGAMRLGTMEPSTHVGSRNIEWALRFLSLHGILTHEVSLGGAFYRKVGWRVGQGAPKVVALPIEGPF